jgi:hypothetical protein
MRKLILAGALALATLGSSAALAGDGFVVGHAEMAQFRSALNLTADQEPYWARIEAAVRDIARRQNAAAATLDGSAIKRLVSAAMPLFRRLDAEQKGKAMALARSLGISSLASLM